MGNGELLDSSGRPLGAHVQVVRINAPFAHPVVVPLPSPGGIQVLTYGGLSPLEWMAGMVAAGGAHWADPHATASAVVECAQAILAACREAQTAQSEKVS